MFPCIQIVLKELPQKESETHLYYIKDEDSVFENECVAPTVCLNLVSIMVFIWPDMLPSSEEVLRYVIAYLQSAAIIVH